MCSARAGTTETATGGGGDEAEAAGGPPGWPDPVPRPQGTPPPPPRLAFLSRLLPDFGKWGKSGGVSYFFLLAALLVQVELEQYPTGPHIASRMLYTVSAAHASCSDSDAFPALLREGRMLSFSSRDGSGMRYGPCLWCDLRVELWNWVPVPPSAQLWFCID